MIAFVAATSPLTVQLPTDTVATTAVWKSSTLAALSVGDRVEVEIDEYSRELKVLHKLVAA